ncbi:hypothetical protein UA08_01300 [Talaromyces atroroseus]|uniref:Cytochrome P450 n=1 Tax=Talaromyces atroroseus TaxID=1441469 RepID=A0A1Q5QA36_TALAT|nr:hypothetical protein UA08_01300 [Talaromyces atroroseus]OKL62751.1 hypothetical protein UA08_01300 [Talaromyces atroroseus]
MLFIKQGFHFLIHGTAVVISPDYKSTNPSMSEFSTANFYSYVTPQGYFSFGWWLPAIPGADTSHCSPRPEIQDIDWYEYTTTGSCNETSCEVHAVNYMLDNLGSPLLDVDYVARFLDIAEKEEAPLGQLTLSYFNQPKGAFGVASHQMISNEQRSSGDCHDAFHTLSKLRREFDVPLNFTFENPCQIIGDEATDYHSLIRDQYVKDKNQIYLLKTPFRTVFVLPPRSVTKYGWLPEHKISSAVDLGERFLSDYTWIGSTTPEDEGDRTHTAITYAKGSLTKNAAQLIDIVYEEVDYALDKELGSDPYMKMRISVHQLTTTIFLHVFERLFLGKELGRNPEWMKLSAEHSGAAFTAAFALSKYHWMIRPVAARFVPEMRRLRSLNATLEQYIQPLHQARLRDLQQPDFKPPADLIQSFIEHAGKHATNSSKLVEAMVQTNIAGISSTGRVLLQALFDLAEHPELVPELNKEIAQVRQEVGGKTADARTMLNPTALAKLHKMDSLFKESQRFRHANLLSVYRKAIQPLRLNGDIVLPAGSYVAVPGAIQATTAEDGSSLPFRPFQWAEKRASAERDHTEVKLGYVFSGPEALEFGAGSHACPGRFFATHALKVALMRILDRYEIRMPAGSQRPPTVYNHLFEMLQDRSAAMEFSAKR